MSVSYSTGDEWEGIDTLNFADASGTITIKTASNPSNIRASFSGDSLETSNISIINAESSQTLHVGDDIDINADTIFEIYNSYGAKIRTGIQDETVKYSYFEKGTIQYYPAFKTYYPKATRSKGSRNGIVSNAASSTYPQDGVSGNYWYTYQGSDNIDAAAVTYSSQEPRGGQPITINVSPSTGNEYGGTVRYTYQVQLAGGAWQTIATNSTATSQQYTIPAGTTTFAARVRASDTWGFSSSDYTTGATLTVINNEPPSAPDGITIGPVLGGEQTTITWGRATDSDGTIASYQLERQIDNGDTWEQIYTGLTRSYDDTINSEWATVNYRVRAVDDDGEAGPYTTGTMQTVNAGWLYFSGPPADMGDRPAPFAFAFSIGSTTDGTTDISVSVLLDDENIYTGTPDAGEQVSLEIDTRLSYEGEHTIVVSFEKENLLGDQYVGT